MRSFCWDKLGRDGGKVDSCRAIFGDESENYEGTLKRHYANGAPTDFATRIRNRLPQIPGKISPRPSRITSTLSIHWRRHALLDSARGCSSREVDFDPNRCRDANQIIDVWLPLSLAMYRTNGASPIFIRSCYRPALIDKLGYIQTLIHAA
jgi:hypothetical protein